MTNADRSDDNPEPTLEPADIELAHRFVTEELGRNANRSTFETRLRPMYKTLGGTAQAGETITYSEIAQAANTDNRRYTSKLLDGISHIEEHHGRPPLSVLVVNADSGRPSEAFMEVVDRYSLRNRYDASSSEALIQAMTADVHRTWES